MKRRNRHGAESFPFHLFYHGQSRKSWRLYSTGEDKLNNTIWLFKGKQFFPLFLIHNLSVFDDLSGTLNNGEKKEIYLHSVKNRDNCYFCLHCTKEGRNICAWSSLIQWCIDVENPRHHPSNQWLTRDEIVSLWSIKWQSLLLNTSYYADNCRQSKFPHTTERKKCQNFVEMQPLDILLQN
jgi:hypothetical protein